MKSINTSPRLAVLAAVIIGLTASELAANRVPPPAPVKNTTTSKPSPFPFSLGKVSGFADYHAHQMGQLGFGGRSQWGSHTGALKSCSGFNHAVSWLPVVGSLIGQPDLGQHPGNRTLGKDWPVWHTTTHQGYWEGWLKKAHQDGMRLFVMSAVNFDMFCSILPKKNTNSEVLADLLQNPQDVTKQCDDMVNIKRQIRAAHAFDKKHWWYEIAKSPGDARRIAQQGKMAVILSVEASKIWGPRWDNRWSTIVSRLNTLESMGVRAFQLTHEIDNNVGGAAIFHALFDIFDGVDQFVNRIPVLLKGNWDEWRRINTKRKDSHGHNVNGLTTVGTKLVHELMKRKLIVDLAHFSRRGFDQVYNISRQYRYYPLHVSHGHFRDMFAFKSVDEKKLGLDEVRKIIQTGGTIGLRTGPERVKTFKRSGVANNCHGSSRSFAQSFMLGNLGYGVKMGFGLDMTGMIAQVRPRFFDTKHKKWGGNFGMNAPSTWACGSDVGKDQRKDAQGAQGNRNSNGTRTDYDLIGLAHVGHTKNLMNDLNKLGVQTHRLMDAAENYIAMWERIHDGNRRALPASPSNRDIDHSSYARSCKRIMLVFQRKTQLGTYKIGNTTKGFNIPQYAPICQNWPDPTVQERNCSGWGFKYYDPKTRRHLCIKQKRTKDHLIFYNGRRIVEDKCPLPHSKISGVKYNGKIVCWSNWDRTIQRRNCSGGGKFRWGNYCVVAQSSYHVRVRKVVRDKCPIPYRYVKSHGNGKIICKPTPHFKIKKRKCGHQWGGYCLWNKGYWYKGRQLK